MVTDAIMNPSAALQSTAEDLLQTLTETPGAAQAELINLILRACGCNDSVDADEALDYDGVVDALDNFTELLKQVEMYLYSVDCCSLLLRTIPRSIHSHPSYPSSRSFASLLVNF